MNKKFSNLETTDKKRKLILSNVMIMDNEFGTKNNCLNIKKKIDLKKINLYSDSNLPLIDINTNKSSKSNKTIFNHINHKTEIDSKNILEKFYYNESSTERRTPIRTEKLLLIPNNRIKINNILKNFDIKKQEKLTNEIKSNKMKLETLGKNKKSIAKSTKSIFSKKKVFLTEGERKDINEIKPFQNNKIIKKTKTNLENIYNKNPDIKKTSENAPFYYSRPYEKAVFYHLKQINDYKYQKYLQLNTIEDNSYNFINKNKLLTKSNIILQLIKSEQNKLLTNYNLYSEQIKKNQKIIELDEKNFEGLKEKQKNLCKEFEKMHLNIYQKNKELEEQEVENHYIIKNNQDEIRRILHKIDELRVFAFFVNEVLGGDITRFENKIIPEDKYEEEIDYYKIYEEVLNKYNYFLLNSPFDDGNIKYNEELMKQEKTFINEPEKMWFKFKEIENIIVRNVFVKENIKNEIKEMIEEKNYNLKDLKQRKEMLEIEYKNLMENFEYEKIKYKEIEKRYISYKIEINEMINDLYNYSSKAFNNFNASNKQYILFDTLDTTKEIYRIIQNSEIYINNLILGLKHLQKEDSILFDKTLDNRKKYLKILKTQKILNQKMKEKFNFILDQNNLNRIPFKSRKTEAPFHKYKKVKKIEIDKSLIERIENEELLTYEKEEAE